MTDKEIGPTGEYPEGKLNDTDEGALVVGVGIRDGKVIIDFGTPVAWLGMRPDDAIDFARQLIETANKVKGTNLWDG